MDKTNETNVYDRRLGELYDYSPALSRRLNHPAVDFYVEESLRAGGPVLHIGVASGKYTLPLARAGLDVVGIDISADMLDVVRGKLGQEDEAVQQRVRLYEQDMRALKLDEPCKTAIMPGNIFLLNLTVEDQLKTLRGVRECLVDNGTLILEAFTPDLMLIAGARSKRSPRQFEFSIPETGERFLCNRTIEVDQFRQLLHHHLIHEKIDPSGRLGERHLTVLTYRYVFPWELIHLLRVGGFVVKQCYGDFESRKPKSKYDGYQVIIAEKCAAIDQVS